MKARAPRWSEMTAVFGGRFDPPHLGHEEAARGILRVPGVAQVLLMPSGSPAYKPTTASGEERLALVKAQCENAPEGDRLEVSDLEIRRARASQGATYTFDTLQSLQPEFGERLAFVLGADQFRDFPKWHRFPEVLELSHWIVLVRKPDGETRIAEALSALLGAGALRARPDWSHQGLECFEVVRAPGRALCVCPTPARDISSTHLRERLARGETPENLPISPAVASCLKRLRLYGTGS